MAGTHPDELALLAYVEDEARDPALAEHVRGCAACSARVRLLEAGRDALRGAPPLELPDQRRERILASLPARREPWRPFRRLGAALPAAAALVLVAAFIAFATQLGDGGSDEEGAGGGADVGAAETAAPQGGEAEQDTLEAEGERSAQTLAGSLLRSVEGPPREVVLLLREAGLGARMRGGDVVVTRGEPEQVERALAGRPAGPVGVYVR